MKQNNFQFLSDKQSTGPTSWFLHAQKAQQALDCICLSLFRLISFRISGAVIKSQLQLLFFFFNTRLGASHFNILSVPSLFGPVTVHVPVKQLWFLNSGYSIPFISQTVSAQVLPFHMMHFGRPCLLYQPELSIQNYRQKMLWQNAPDS